MEGSRPAPFPLRRFPWPSDQRHRGRSLRLPPRGPERPSPGLYPRPRFTHRASGQAHCFLSRRSPPNPQTLIAASVPFDATKVKPLDFQSVTRNSDPPQLFLDIFFLCAIVIPVDNSATNKPIVLQDFAFDEKFVFSLCLFLCQLDHKKSKLFRFSRL